MKCLTEKEIIFNAENERIKKKYYQYAKEAGQKSQMTIDNIRKSISRYENSTKLKNFQHFHKNDVIDFKEYLSGLRNRKGEPLSKSTILSATREVKEFFKWLAYQPGFRKRINLLDLEYFNLQEKDVRMAKTPSLKDFPTIEQIRKVLTVMPQTNDVQKRDRALIAFTLVSGMRDRAIVSLKLKHIDLDRNPERITQDARDGVKTKFSKTITSFLFPVGDDIKQIVIDWINYLKKEMLFSENSPVFPRTKMILDENNTFISAGLEQEHWSGANQVREVFQKAFTAAGLPYFNPHSFRNTIVNLGERLCRNPEEFKAWSQNLGHERVMTTFSSYGIVPTFRQGEILKELTNQKPETQDRLSNIENLLKRALQSQSENI